MVAAQNHHMRHVQYAGKFMLLDIGTIKFMVLLLSQEASPKELRLYLKVYVPSLRLIIMHSYALQLGMGLGGPFGGFVNDR